MKKIEKINAVWTIQNQNGETIEELGRKINEIIEAVNKICSQTSGNSAVEVENKYSAQERAAKKCEDCNGLLNSALDKYHYGCGTEEPNSLREEILTICTHIAQDLEGTSYHQISPEQVDQILSLVKSHLLRVGTGKVDREEIINLINNL